MLHNPGYSARPRPRAPCCVAILALFSSFSSLPLFLSRSLTPPSIRCHSALSCVRHHSLWALSFLPPITFLSHTLFLGTALLPSPFSLPLRCCFYVIPSFLPPFPLSCGSGWSLPSSRSPSPLSSSLPLTFARVSSPAISHALCPELLRFRNLRISPRQPRPPRKVQAARSHAQRVSGEGSAAPADGASPRAASRALLSTCEELAGGSIAPQRLQPGTDFGGKAEETFEPRRSPRGTRRRRCCWRAERGRGSARQLQLSQQPSQLAPTADFPPRCTDTRAGR